METKFTEQESLAVIDEMINRARNNVQKGSANNMIYNGIVVASVALLNFLLIHILPAEKVNMSFWIWMLMIPSCLIDYFMKRKKGRSAIVKTQLDGIISWLWWGFSISVILLVIILMTMIIVFKNGTFGLLFTPVIMLFVAIVEFGMAKATRFKPFHWGAIGFWTGTILCLLSFVILKRGDLHFLILAVCMVVGFVIPGYILNSKAKKDV